MTGPRGGVCTVTPSGLVRHTIYFSPEEWARMEDECRVRQKREGGQVGVTTLLRGLVAARYGLPQPGKGANGR